MHFSQLNEERKSFGFGHFIDAILHNHLIWIGNALSETEMLVLSSKSHPPTTGQFAPWLIVCLPSTVSLYKLFLLTLLLQISASFSRFFPQQKMFSSLDTSCSGLVSDFVYRCFPIFQSQTVLALLTIGIQNLLHPRGQ